GAGSDTLDGGEGNDTALYSGNASDYTVTKLADGRVKITGPGAYDYLSNIEALQFADKRVELSEGTAAPVIAAADDHGELLEDGSIRLDLLGNDEGRDLLVTGFQATTTQGGQVTFNQDGSFTYRPAQDFHGTDSFTYQVTDRNGATASATATLNVAAVNDAPLARPDAFEVVHGEAFHGQGLLANDSDVDGDPLSVSDFDAVSAGGGTVEVAADGSFTYKPADGFSGEDSFTYTLDDGQGGTAIGTVTLTVAAPSGPTAPEGAIVGTAGDDVLTGTAGDDVLFGAEGADTMIGGTGDDTYYVDNAGDRIVEGYGAATNGYDTVISTVDYALEDSAWVETLQAGSDAGLSLTGNKGYNNIIGGAGDDRLDGGAGNDKLFGGAGDDILIAGAGSDTLDGGEGNDTALYEGKAADYTVNYASDGRVVVKGEGTYDYLSNIENLQFADQTFALESGGGTTEPPAPGDGDSAPSKPPVTSPPPSGPTAGVVTGPQIVQAQGAGEIVGMQIASQSGQAAAAQTMTIGQVFAAGDLQPGQGLVARIGDADVPVQVDVKALNDDGSVRHAVLSFEAPALSAGESLDVMLKQGAAASGSTIDPLSALQAQGHDLKLEVSVQGGSPVVLDMESLLAQAKQNGTLETWL
ncbi:MAG: tandem-95 repeat protein, partial [Tistlia sp.]